MKVFFFISLLGLLTTTTLLKVFWKKLTKQYNWKGIEKLSEKQQFALRLPKIILTIMFFCSFIAFWMSIGMIPVLRSKVFLLFIFAIIIHIIAWIFFFWFLGQIPSGSVSDEKIGSGEDYSGIIENPAFYGVLKFWGKWIPEIIIPPSKYFKLPSIWNFSIVNAGKHNSDFEISGITTKDGANVHVKGSVTWWVDFRQS